MLKNYTQTVVISNAVNDIKQTNKQTLPHWYKETQPVYNNIDVTVISLTCYRVKKKIDYKTMV